MRILFINIIFVVGIFMMTNAICNSTDQLQDSLLKISAGHKNSIIQEQKKQSNIIEEGKSAVLENNNKSTKSFMFVPANGHVMRTDTKKEIYIWFQTVQHIGSSLASGEQQRN